MAHHCPKHPEVPLVGTTCVECQAVFIHRLQAENYYWHTIAGKLLELVREWEAHPAQVIKQMNLGGMAGALAGPIFVTIARQVRCLLGDTDYVVSTIEPPLPVLKLLAEHDRVVALLEHWERPNHGTDTDAEYADELRCALEG